jgi:putative NADPH-quinone reductase
VSEAFVVLGTSRRGGNTARAARIAFPDTPIVDLNDHAITAYDYEHRYPENDDFLSLAERMIRRSDIVMATPVYWYAMSAQLKRFLDRWSDLITIRKDLGRALAGKRLWVLATSPDPELPPGFEEPFRLTADYMDMSYAGALHVSCPDDLALGAAAQAALVAFGERIRAA